MSEHRSNAAKVTNLPLPELEEDWPLEIIDEWTIHAQHVEAYLDAGCLGIEELLRVQRAGTEILDLYWQGLPPGRAEKFIEALAPSWAELLDLIALSREKAKAMLEKKRRASNG